MMSHERYYLVLDGDFFIDDFLSIKAADKINDVGLMVVDVPIDSPCLAHLELDMHCICYRTWTLSYANSYRTQLFYGIYRGRRRTVTAAGDDAYSLNFVSAMSILNRAIIAFRPNVINFSQWSAKALQQILYDMVGNNVSMIGSQFARDKAKENFNLVAVFPVVLNPAMPVIDYAASRVNLLSEMQKVAALGPLDFFIVWDDANSRWKWDMPPNADDNLLGEDRTGEIVFSIDVGNVSSEDRDGTRLSEPTIAIVGGRGTGVDKNIEIQYGPNYDASTNAAEIYVNAGGTATDADAQAAGDAALENVAFKETFSFSTRWAPEYTFVKDYGLGDRVSALVDDAFVQKRIVGYSLLVDRDGHEGVDLELIDWG